MFSERSIMGLITVIDGGGWSDRGLRYLRWIWGWTIGPRTKSGLTAARMQAG